MPHQTSAKTTSAKTLLAAAFGAGLAAAAVCGALPAAADTAHTTDSPFGTSVRGSGALRTQPRTVGAFNAISASGGIDLDLRIGPQAAVTVEADDNLQDLIRTEVHDGTLVLDSRGSWSSRHDPVVHVTVPAIERLETNGSGQATLNDLAADTLKITLSGSGGVSATGKVRQLQLAIEGSGDADLDNLDIRAAAVRIDGSGNANLSPRDSLDATINGSGDVRYTGLIAHLSTQIHGTGDVVRQ
ncbi:MAG: DUF2807 domain-containing protein [Nevskia sp.]|nr:DUF2807 domain-containing protein [Nevskia sp.]